MDKIKIGINGFGRIGRAFFRSIQHRQDIEVVGINDLADPITLAHLLKYDSVHGVYKGIVNGGKNKLTVKGISIRVFEESEPDKIPWGVFGADVVVECTGKFLDEESALRHLAAGAKKVVLSAPAKGEKIKTIVIGVNEGTIKSSDKIVSNASCTTNNVAPMLKVLDENWGIDSAYITTVHAYTSDQSLHDAPHRDLRRARAAAVSIIPTTTGAAKAVTEIFPKMKGKIGGAGIRVPVPDGSLTDLTCILKKDATVESINKIFKEASEFGLKGILQYTEDPIVSVDIIGNPHSCIFDSQLTSTVGHMVKVVGWYDNEMGYAARLADLVVKVANA